MKKNDNSQKINVRILKRPVKKKTNFLKTEQKKENIKKVSPEEERKKKFKIIFSVAVVLVIVFVAWFSLLGRTFSRIDRQGESFFQKTMTDLKDEFNDIISSFQEAKSSLSNESEPGIDEKLEKDIFPETK